MADEQATVEVIASETSSVVQIVVQGSQGIQGPAGADGADGAVGAPGADGADGADGAPGADGADGADGATWTSGSGAPNNATGNDGDFYFRTDTNDIYKRAAGVYGVIANVSGPQGPAGVDGADGADGTDGATWRSGSGAPSNALGVDGDLYLNTANGDVYTKSSGVYGITANIKGPQGAAGANGADGADGTDGTIWTSGSGAPSNAVGVDGDFYYRTDTNQIYKRVSGTYSVIVSIHDRTPVVYTADQTAQLTDNHQIVELNKATAINYTLPQDSDVAFPVGSQMDVVQIGAGQAAFVQGTGATILSLGGNLKLNGQYAAATAYKRAANTWVVTGNLKA